MAAILHRIAINNVGIETVYRAISTIEGLAAWWTVDTSGTANRLGGALQFRFPGGGFDMQVVDLRKNELLEWEVVGGEKEWIGTKIRWALTSSENFTVLLFKHDDWKEPTEFMHHCSTKWAIFLMSLKSYLETGTGAPSPHDVKIDDWN